MYNGTTIRLTVDFAETTEARKQWDDIFQSGKRKNYQPRILYSSKLTYKNENEIKKSSYNHGLREFISSWPALKEDPQVERKYPQTVTQMPIEINSTGKVNYAGKCIKEYKFICSLPLTDFFKVA